MTAKSPKRGSDSGIRKDHLYCLEVCLINGPVTEEFVDRNPVVSRTIQIRGDQTLEDLHYAIFDAFDREDEHIYEFQFGKGPQDPKNKRYVLPMAMEDSLLPPEGPTEDLTRTAIASLDLKVDQMFGYWFDFGDDWWHQINVVAVEGKVPKGKYPRVTKRVGESPPQYLWDDEEEDWDDEDEEVWGEEDEEDRDEEDED